MRPEHWIYTIPLRLRSLFRRQEVDLELDEELRYHLEQKAEEYLAKGHDPVEARRRAALDMDGIERSREECREMRKVSWLHDLIQDLQFGARILRRSPGFTVVAVVTLALGIGANTAIFSAVNPVLFESLPYPQSDRVMMIWDHGPDSSRLEVTFGTYRELMERSRSFDALAVMRPWQPTVTGPAEPERLEGQRASSSYFRVLGVSPVMGRDFEASDDGINGSKVVILSNGLWQRRFGSDPTIIGRQIQLDDESYTVVGVMPGGFENVLLPAAEIWSPLQYHMSQGRAWGHHLRMVGRLRPDVEAEQARQELNSIAHAPVPEFPRVPWASIEHGLIVNSLHADVTRGVKPALLAVLGAALLVLTIACVNVTNLLLARGVHRRSEFALRAALGATRWRTIRQQLAESLLLAVLGGALGMVVAEFGVRALVALSPAELPRAGPIRLDGAVFAFGMGITTLIGVLTGLIPALHASRSDLQVGLQQSSRRLTGSHQTLRRALVVTEVALALVLLVSAGLLLRSIRSLLAISPGFDAAHLLTMQVQTAGRRFDKETTNRFFAQALAAVGQVQGVTSAAFTSQLLLSGDFDEYGVSFDSSASNESAAVYPAFRYAVSPGYFETLRIPVRRGRLLDAHDTTSAPRAAVISESFAKKLPGRDPIGQRIHVGPTDRPWYAIVGVVGDVKQTSLAESRTDAVYVTPEQWPFADRAQWLVVRARGDMDALAPTIRRAIWSVDKDQPIVRVARMEELVAASAAKRRFALFVFEAFALAALVLAAAGIYGVLSGSVAERTHEIGVRTALGASRASILALVVRQGMTLTVIGVAIGLAGAVAATQAITTLLFGVSRLDPVTYSGVVALLLGVSGIACWVPAWRAAQVDPIVALRHE